MKFSMSIPGRGAPQVLFTDTDCRWTDRGTAKGENFLFFLHYEKAFSILWLLTDESSFIKVLLLTLILHSDSWQAWQSPADLRLRRKKSTDRSLPSLITALILSWARHMARRSRAFDKPHRYGNRRSTVTLDRRKHATTRDEWQQPSIFRWFPISVHITKPQTRETFLHSPGHDRQTRKLPSRSSHFFSLTIGLKSLFFTSIMTTVKFLQLQRLW